MPYSKPLIECVIFCHLFLMLSAQICPLNPECMCSGFVGTVPTVIDCSDQGRTSIPVSQINPGVQTLIMSGNPIILEAGALANLTNLKVLDLSRASLRYIPAGSFYGLVSLESLWLEGNLFTSENLVSANFSGTQNITSLVLANNQLSKRLSSEFLSFFTKLKELNLASNQYKYLEVGFFDVLSSTLESLILSSNLLTNLPASIFFNLTQLILLDLSGNRLSTLPESIFSNLSSTEIHLAGNPWSCDCHLSHLTNLISNPGSLNFSDASTAYCAVPSSLSNTPLQSATGLTCSAPAIITQPQNASLLTTQSVTFNCTNTGLPTPIVSWFHNGDFIIDSSTVSAYRYTVLPNGVLSITNITLGDSGTYYCVVANTEGSENSSIAFLTVREITCFDNVTTSSHETDVDCGGPYCVPCLIGQKCALNSDCENEICLYSESIPSQLLYITRNDELAFTCNSIEVGLVALQMRFSAVFFGNANFQINTSSDLGSINQLVRQSLATQLSVPIDVIANVNVRTVERFFMPLIQVYFSLSNNHYGIMAQNLLIEQINTEKLRATMRLETLQNSIAVRINF